MTVSIKAKSAKKCLEFKIFSKSLWTWNQEEKSCVNTEMFFLQYLLAVRLQITRGEKRLGIPRKKGIIGIKRNISFHLSLVEIILSPHRILNSNEMLHFKEFLHYLKN